MKFTGEHLHRMVIKYLKINAFSGHHQKAIHELLQTSNYLEMPAKNGL